MDADFDLAVAGVAMPQGVAAALAEAAAYGGDDPRAVAALRRAQALAPDHPATLIALYRHHFYGHRLGEARELACQALVVAADALRLPAAWREVPPVALSGARHDAGTRFYLFALKAYAYLSLRLGDEAEAREALIQLRALDPEDRVGTTVLEDVLRRAGEGEPDDEAAPAGGSIGTEPRMCA